MVRFVRSTVLLAGCFVGLLGIALTTQADEKTAAGPAVPPALESLFGGPFSLIDHHNIRRTDEDFRGKYMLIFFGYTYCPTICPTNLEHMAWALETLGERARDIQPIFVTIDPARDTPELLGDYVSSFDADILALTGEETEIVRVAKAYRIHRVKVVPEGGDRDDYLVDHSSITYLMGPDGKFVTLFPHNTSGDVMGKRIADYLANSSSSAATN